MLIREKRMDVFKKCLVFLDTRVALDQSGFKFDIFEHMSKNYKTIAVTALNIKISELKKIKVLIAHLTEQLT